MTLQDVAPVSLKLDAGRPESLSRWRTLVDVLFPPLRILPDRSHEFGGHIAAVGRPDLRLTDITASPHRVERTPERITGVARDYYKVSFQVHGHGVMRQSDRELTLAPGSIAVYDTGRPYELEFATDYRFIVAMFPKTALSLPPGITGELTAHPFGEDQGLGVLMGSYVHGLAANLQLLAGTSGELVAQNFLDLVSAFVAEQLEVSAIGERAERTVLLLRVLRHIDGHLTDPGLDPASIAEAHFISVRHLYNVFRLTGASVSAWIKERRLLGARRELADPRLGELTVAQVAVRWGFADHGYFGRQFRERFGITPGVWAATQRGVERAADSHRRAGDSDTREGLVADPRS